MVAIFMQKISCNLEIVAVFILNIFWRKKSWSLVQFHVSIVKFSNNFSNHSLCNDFEQLSDRFFPIFSAYVGPKGSFRSQKFQFSQNRLKGYKNRLKSDWKSNSRCFWMHFFVFSHPPIVPFKAKLQKKKKEENLWL